MGPHGGGPTQQPTDLLFDRKTREITKVGFEMTSIFFYRVIIMAINFVLDVGQNIVIPTAILR